MRVFGPYGLLQCLVLMVIIVVSAEGCSRRVLQTRPAGQQDIEVAMEAFGRYRRISAEVCNCCLDAEADASLSMAGWFTSHKGHLAGYIQAMEPGYVKFVAINPLGQPLYIFLTNGKMFKSINIFEEKVYAGSVHSEIYRKFAPPGFEPEFFFYWLTGRLQPDGLQVLDVMYDRQQEKFWIQLNHENSRSDSMVLFDPGQLLILRHIIRDDQGKHLADILYEDHQLLPGRDKEPAADTAEAIGTAGGGLGGCLMPARITVSSQTGAGKVELKLHSFIDDARFAPEDFQLRIPANFKQLLVK